MCSPLGKLTVIIELCCDMSRRDSSFTVLLAGSSERENEIKFIKENIFMEKNEKLVQRIKLIVKVQFKGRALRFRQAQGAEVVQEVSDKLLSNKVNH